jgi:hypothetical protein
MCGIRIGARNLTINVTPTTRTTLAVNEAGARWILDGGSAGTGHRDFGDMQKKVRIYTHGWSTKQRRRIQRLRQLTNDRAITLWPLLEQLNRQPTGWWGEQKAMLCRDSTARFSSGC